ncbi:hypothetical protein N657DRAFT_674818 [Parathielavia appendiculata]|uniref:Protein kinase domain-containing protein n=1 Tax=Parathielavia appendiculata TaxID=2587402 RepID=A0AAN6TT26_9PEZI|nr:hypothetical protein N657DRAFT_674818 [Parathielavia appendiculata]
MKQSSHGNARLERTLGWGGNGIASLFYVDPGNGAPRDYFVAKTCINPASRAAGALCEEKNMQNNCITMEYPPGQDLARSLPRDAQGQVFGVYGERVPPACQAAYDQALADRSWNHEGKTPGGAGVVHFDIDPQNILLGNINIGPANDRHALLPVFQLTDCGLARAIDLTYVSNARRRGTVGFLNDRRENPRPKTAGKYCWKTNLYQFAVVRHPITQEEIEISDPNNPGRLIKAWSYGAYILNDRHWGAVDGELRRLVAQCMCDEPAHRPELQELQATIASRLANTVWAGTDSDANVQAWMQQNIGNPAPPQNPPGQLPLWFMCDRGWTE